MLYLRLPPPAAWLRKPAGGIHAVFKAAFKAVFKAVFKALAPRGTDTQKRRLASGVFQLHFVGEKVVADRLPAQHDVMWLLPKPQRLHRD